MTAPRPRWAPRRGVVCLLGGTAPPPHRFRSLPRRNPGNRRRGPRSRAAASRWKRAAREADRAVITACVQANETLLLPAPARCAGAGRYLSPVAAALALARPRGGHRAETAPTGVGGIWPPRRLARSPTVGARRRSPAPGHGPARPAAVSPSRDGRDTLMSQIRAELTVPSATGLHPYTVDVPVPRCDLTGHEHRRYHGGWHRPRSPAPVGRRRLPVTGRAFPGGANRSVVPNHRSATSSRRSSRWWPPSTARPRPSRPAQALGEPPRPAPPAVLPGRCRCPGRGGPRPPHGSVELAQPAGRAR